MCTAHPLTDRIYTLFEGCSESSDQFCSRKSTLCFSENHYTEVKPKGDSLGRHSFKAFSWTMISMISFDWLLIIACHVRTPFDCIYLACPTEICRFNREPCSNPCTAFAALQAAPEIPVSINVSILCSFCTLCESIVETCQASCICDWA